jgi:hypothetical protein
LALREKLFRGDRIETGDGAQVVLVLFSKTTLDVVGPASFGIGERSVELSSGKVILAAFTELLKENEVYSLIGRDAVAQFRDTASMQVESSQRMGGMSEQVTTTICAERGVVRVTVVGEAETGLDTGECLKIGGDPLTFERTAKPPPVSVPGAGPLPKLHP